MAEMEKEITLMQAIKENELEEFKGKFRKQMEKEFDAEKAKILDYVKEL